VAGEKQMQEVDPKVTLTFEREGAETTQMTVDGYVLVAWNVDAEGLKHPVINTSEPVQQAGNDLVHAVGALSLAMEKHPVDGVQVMGKLVKAAMSKGMGMLEAATRGEVPEG
jgi:hypothetical protein